MARRTQSSDKSNIKVNQGEFPSLIQINIVFVKCKWPNLLVQKNHNSKVKTNKIFINKKIKKIDDEAQAFETIVFYK